MAAEKKPPARSAQQRLAAQRAAAARERLAAAQRRRRLIIVGGTVASLVLVVAVLIIVKVATGAGAPKSGQTASAASAAVIADVTSVPPAVLDTVGVGSITALPKAITAPALEQGGKPRFLYIGAEYCPYCATERWAVVVALSRFGTFTNLGQTASSPSDVYPSTATLTFHGASYRSAYLAFTGTETESNQVSGTGYAPLDKLSAADQAVFAKYNPGGSIPFIDIGGKYIVSGASYSPTSLQGKTHSQIAAALSQPSSPIAKGVDGAANIITAAICKTTNSVPSKVCTASGVAAASTTLSNG